MSCTVPWCPSAPACKLRPLFRGSPRAAASQEVVMPRTRTFAFSTLTAAILAACLASSGIVAPIHAKEHDDNDHHGKDQVPFRLMEATISETQDALEAGTVTSEDLVKLYLARIDAFDKQ